MKTYKEKVRDEYKAYRAKGYRPRDALAIAKAYTRYKDGEKCPFDNKWGDEGKEERTYSNGWKLVFEVCSDNDSGPPQENCDCHGKVEWLYRALEDWESDWVVYQDRYPALLYDRKASLEIAKRDGWGPGTPEEAVQADFDYLYGWYNQDWWYIGIIVTLFDDEGDEVGSDSCWGYETRDMSYVTSEARNWAAHLLKEHMPRYWQRLRQRELCLEEAA